MHALLIGVLMHKITQGRSTWGAAHAAQDLPEDGLHAREGIALQFLDALSWIRLRHPSQGGLNCRAVAEPVEKAQHCTCMHQADKLFRRTLT